MTGQRPLSPDMEEAYSWSPAGDAERAVIVGVPPHDADLLRWWWRCYRQLLSLLVHECPAVLDVLDRPPHSMIVPGDAPGVQFMHWSSPEGKRRIRQRMREGGMRVRWPRR